MEVSVSTKMAPMSVNAVKDLKVVTAWSTLMTVLRNLVW
jgi:hypothetical protein